MRSVLQYALSMPGIAAPFGPLRRGQAVIFMLHRLRSAEARIGGINPADLRRGLEYLRCKRYDLMSLAEVFERLAGDGGPLDRSVAFTMDDGYFDQATVAGPIFAEFDCPVTTFVSTGFLDRRLWFWWDQIEYVFDQTRRRQLQVRFGQQLLSYRWDDETGRAQVRRDFVRRCKEVPDGEKEAGIKHLAAEADVDVPIRAPERYEPMPWETLRRCEARGMSFGPHSVTHSILGLTEPDVARREIVESWTRLRAEARSPVPVFCYPGGRARDFRAHEIAVLKSEGFAGAVDGEPGYADVRSFQRNGDGPFKVHRFSYPESLADLVQIITGVERFKQFIRGQA